MGPSQPDGGFVSRAGDAPVQEPWASSDGESTRLSPSSDRKRPDEASRSGGLHPNPARGSATPEVRSAPKSEVPEVRTKPVDPVAQRIHRRRTRGRRLRSLLAVLVSFAVFLALGGVSAAVLGKIYLGGAMNGEEVGFSVEEGQSVAEVAESLEREGVVKSAPAFLLYLKIKRKSLVVQAGEYKLRKRMSAAAVIAALEAGPVYKYRDVTFPPGFTVRQQGQRVADELGFDSQRFLDALSSRVHLAGFPEARSPEGLCYPDTYRVGGGTDETALAETCLGRFAEVFSSLDRSGLSRLGITEYQAVIVASLIEREARVESERPLVASVIYNRLKKAMKLEIDATVLYALGYHKEKLTYADLGIDSPYNTYKYAGLPPTPIAAPGKSSLEAALAPAQTDFLYYVLTDPSGKHSFTSDPKEFERLKADAISRGVY